MVASTAALHETPESTVLEMAEQIQALADSGEWSEVEHLAVRLRSAIMSVPEARRRDVILAVQRATELVAAEADSAQRDVTGKLKALRRGQKATKAYELR